MIVHSSPYSLIKSEPAKKAMYVTWLNKSIELDENQVKSEIEKILDYTKGHPVSAIVVDSRNYPFRENNAIQHWINHTYMPQIIDHGIKRYAIVVENKIKSVFEDFTDVDDAEDGILVEYFTSPEEAQRWIES
jgi:hypothetical protein